MSDDGDEADAEVFAAFVAAVTDHDEDQAIAAFGALAASGWLRARIGSELAALAAEPTHLPSVAIAAHGWVLWMGPEGMKLTLVRLQPGAGDDADYLTDTAAGELITPVDGRAVEVTRLGIGAGDGGIDDPEVMQAGRGLVALETRTLAPGEVLVIAPREVADIRPAAEARHLLMFEGPPRFSQRWVYSRETLAPIASIAADPHDARLEAGMRLLRVLGHTPGAEVCVKLASYPAHFVRWSAIRYAMGLDPEVGLSLLAGAQDDPHPHVRAAAARAWSRLEGDAPG